MDLDELPRTLISECHEIISSFLQIYPDMRVVITGPIDYLDGFITLGFAPLAMSYWNHTSLISYLKGLCKSFFNRISPDLK